MNPQLLQIIANQRVVELRRAAASARLARDVRTHQQTLEHGYPTRARLARLKRSTRTCAPVAARATTIDPIDI